MILIIAGLMSFTLTFTADLSSFPLMQGIIFSDSAEHFH